MGVAPCIFADKLYFLSLAIVVCGCVIQPPRVVVAASIIRSLKNNYRAESTDFTTIELNRPSSIRLD